MPGGEIGDGGGFGRINGSEEKEPRRRIPISRDAIQRGGGRGEAVAAVGGGEGSKLKNEIQEKELEGPPLSWFRCPIGFSLAPRAVVSCPIPQFWRWPGVRWFRSPFAIWLRPGACGSFVSNSAILALVRCAALSFPFRNLVLAWCVRWFRV